MARLLAAKPSRGPFDQHLHACGDALASGRQESDRAVRLARMAALVKHVFGEAEGAWRWLRAAKRQPFKAADHRVNLEEFVGESAALLKKIADPVSAVK